MPSTQAPNVGLNHSWDLGESGWNLQMDENLRALDALLFLTVASLSTDVPGAPVAGDRYIVPVSATGAWAGQDLKVARYDGAAWEFFLPRTGWVAFVADLNVHKKFNGTSWADSVSTTGAENKGLTGGGGTGIGLFISKVGATLGFKSLVAGSNVAFDTSTDPEQIIINASASGGTGGIAEAPDDGNAYVRKALGWVRGLTRSGDRVLNIRETVQSVTTGSVDANAGGIVNMTLSAPLFTATTARRWCDAGGQATLGYDGQLWPFGGRHRPDDLHRGRPRRLHLRLGHPRHGHEHAANGRLVPVQGLRGECVSLRCRGAVRGGP